MEIWWPAFFCRVLKMPMMVVRCGILLVGKFRDYGWQKHTQYFSRIFWPRISLRFLIHLWSEHVRPQNKDFTMASQSPKSSSPICWFVALTCPCNTCRYKMIYIHITSEQIILYIYNIYELYTTFQLRFIWPNQAVCGVIDASSPLLGSLIFFVTSHICIHFLQPVFKRPLDFSMGRSETNTSTWETILDEIPAAANFVPWQLQHGDLVQIS